MYIQDNVDYNNQHSADAAARASTMLRTISMTSFQAF